MYKENTRKLGIPRPLYHKIMLTMRLTTVILLASLLQVSAATFGQRITMNRKNIPLESVLKEIRKQTGYDIFFDSKLIPKDQQVSVTLNNATLDEAFAAAFKGLNLTYKIDRNSVSIRKAEAPSFLEPVVARIMAIDVRGRLVDSESGQPLAGATVKVKGTNRSMTTNIDGVFFIQNVDDDAVLEISYVGYKAKEVKAAKEIGDIKIEMVSSDLEEVNVEVNTGYQTLPKERATGSFAKVDNKLFNRRVSTDVLSRLEGVVPGLLFNRNTGAASNGATDLSIRGYSTLFSDAQPLIVLDNFPYDGKISNINPNDIESVTVLKDAAAASIWGARSGNGVIVITTKKGKLNQRITAELNSNLTVGQKPDLWYSPNFISSSDFIALEQKMYETDFYNQAIMEPNSPISPVIDILARKDAGTITSDQAANLINGLKSIDSRDDLSKYLYQKSANQQYSANLRGGTINTNFAFSLGYDSNRSNLVGNDNQRYTLNGTYNYSLTKDWNVSTGLNFTQTRQNRNDVLGTLNSVYPYTKLSDSNGAALAVSENLNSLWLSDENAQKGLLDWYFRPLDELNLVDNISKLSDLRIILGTQYRFLKRFSAEVKYAFQKGIGFDQNHNSIESYYARDMINRFTNLSGNPRNPIPLGGILYRGNDITNSNRLRGQINYDSDFNNKHNLTGLIGAEFSDVINENDNSVTYGYNKNNRTFQNVDFVNQYPTIPSFGQSAQIPNNISFSKFTDRYISYFSNLAYTFLSKYTLSLSGRIDKSNLFGVNINQKSIPLYSIGVSWDLNKESYYNVNWLQKSKLRITYGSNGNVNRSVAAVTTTRQYSNSFYNNLPWATISSPGNPELRWEKVKLVNFGYDFELKSKIISGSIEYYRKKASDLFSTSQLAPSTGFVNFYGNTASTKGEGWELTLNSINVKSRKFCWLTSLIYNAVQDKVTEYYEEPTVNNILQIGPGNGGTIYPIIDKPLFAMYSYKSSILNPENGDPQGYVNNELSTNYFDIISKTKKEDLIFHGSSRPTSFGSFRNSFIYDRFNLSVNLVYKLNYFFRRNSIDYYALFIAGRGHQDFYKRWQTSGDELKTTVPSIQYPPNDINRDMFYTYSDKLVTKGDHVRIQDISLSYEFKDFAPFRSFEIFTYINNVGILWKANNEGLDPDLYYGQTNVSPIPRTLSAGIKATF
ncbi:TonB-linked SusC/RagA family outer membrane protein [Pedobacter sp. AK017]|uniref:SusC/RagA family TonB-linked outer membrane protein n=1 Tax=Pedobacter sp. AK017 TaxID=2723073 RepID=UPI00160919A4|nr:SusC/RagA family TonB-linked outer membrane protein [Pedobacter sp. AK017]MBB5440661.1 TonB-linked SusC/RagA family outer membrane protein [Pedobacter sp. AK017]